jgi:Zn-dependent M28 family amino/carboxypeptidase
MRPIIISLSLLSVLLVSAQQPKHKKAAAGPATFGNSDAITEQELKIHEYFLASDQLEGRNLPSRGFDTAALYVASKLAEWGVEPAGSASGTNGPLQPYFMPFELVSNQVNAADSKASITGKPAPRGQGRRGGQGGGPGGPDAPPPAAPTSGPSAASTPPAPAAPPATTTNSFEYGKDWSVPVGFRGPPIEAFNVSGNVVFVGNGYVINKTKTDPFEGMDVTGKIVVVAGLPTELRAQAAGPVNPQAANPLGEACTDFLTPEQAAAKHGAAAVIHLATYQQLATGFAGPVNPIAGANGPNYRVVKFPPNAACPSAPSIVIGPSMTISLFQGEKQTGEQVFAGSVGAGKQDSFELTAEKKVTLKVAVKSTPNHAENVVGIVRGSDPVLKNEFVVVSAHLDHIGLTLATPPADNVNNGADDDGSGSTALLAIARVYAQGAANGMRPKRSMIFLWNAGEEKGLWGSQYFAEFPPVDITKIVADLNIDMIGRTKGPDFKDPEPTHVLVVPSEIMIIGPNISSDDLEKTIETTNSAYQKLTLNHFYDVTAPDKTHDNLGPQPRGQRIFYRSDHYNFAKVGVPIAFFTTGLHPDYHRVTDSPDKLDYHSMMVYTKTISAVGWTLANQSGRPAINATLPDQLKKDMKLAQDQGWGKLTPVLTPLPGEPF